MAGGDDGGVIVAPHHAEGDKVAIRKHQHGLGKQDDQQRPGHLGQLPQLHGHERHGQEERQRHVAHHLELAQGQRTVAPVDDVAHHRRHQHRAQVRRQRNAQALEPVDQQRACPDGHGNQDAGVHHSVAVAHGGRGCKAGGGGIGGVDSASRRGGGTGWHARSQPRGVQAIAPHQQGAQRAANHTTRHQAIGGRCNGGGQRTCGARLLQQRAKRGRGAVPTRERYGPRRHADERMHAQRSSQPGAQQVLQHHQAHGGGQKQRYADTAFLEQLEAGRKADGGEKHQQQKGAHVVVELKGEQARLVAHQRNQRKHQSADDGPGNEVTREQADAVFDEIAHHQQHGGDADGLGNVEFNGGHGGVSLRPG